jgi:hypothetical protein
LLGILRRNEELTAEDAEAELRWIRQALQDDAGVTLQGHQSVQSKLESFVARRGQGEPLQYILGEFSASLARLMRTARHLD